MTRRTLELIPLVGKTGPILGLALSPFDTTMASTSSDNTLRVWVIWVARLYNLGCLHNSGCSYKKVLSHINSAFPSTLQGHNALVLSTLIA